MGRPRGISTYRQYFQSLLRQIILSEMVDLTQDATILIGVHPESPTICLRIGPTCRCAANRLPGHTGSSGKRVISLAFKLNFAVFSHQRGQMDTLVVPFDSERCADQTGLNQAAECRIGRGPRRQPRLLVRLTTTSQGARRRAFLATYVLDNAPSLCDVFRFLNQHCAK